MMTVNIRGHVRSTHSQTPVDSDGDGDSNGDSNEDGNSNGSSKYSRPCELPHILKYLFVSVCWACACTNTCL
jgi:hypothetical protein